MTYAQIVATCAVVALAYSTEGSARASLSFPRDYGVHTAGVREWWSIGAHLVGNRGRHFSVHASFFRFSVGSHEDLYSAEYSVLDSATGRVESGATSARMERVRGRSNATIAVDRYTFVTDVASGRSDVTVASHGGPGGSGFSLNSLPEKPPAASLAFGGYSITRLKTTGSVEYDGSPVAVVGMAWLDHEYELGAVTPRIGWERFELQLDDGRDIELFASRLRDGRYAMPSQRGGAPGLAASRTPYGPRVPIEGFVVDRNGRRHALARDAIRLVIQGNTLWHSARDDATYPALWQLALQGDADAMTVEPTVRDQEIVPADNGVALWCGSVTLADLDPPGTALGVGFVELSGFATATPL